MNLNVVVISNLLPRAKLLQNWTDLAYAVKAGVDTFFRKIWEPPQKFCAPEG
jgi:hypothetical protein